MARLTKKQKEATSHLEANKVYNLTEASSVVKQISIANFDASVDIAVRLNVDPRKANQMVRGVVTLPHGTGKDVKVLALVTPDKEAEAKEAGADYVGLDEYLDKIKGGWTDVDVIVTMPSVMGKLGPLGRILGPRGLMPNPKTGTVTMDVAKAVSDVKAGKIDFKVDKTGIVRSTFIFRKTDPASPPWPATMAGQRGDGEPRVPLFQLLAPNERAQEQQVEPGQDGERDPDLAHGEELTRPAELHQQRSDHPERRQEMPSPP